MALGKKRLHLEAVDTVALGCPQNPRKRSSVAYLTTTFHSRREEKPYNNLRATQKKEPTGGLEAYLNKSDLVYVPERPKTPLVSVYFDGEDQSNADTTNKEEKGEEEAKG
ncbi:hypothetical protein F2Q69_00018812 [Brassica cretica]|uniref:Uncharacterized protein n=1 Tax=Brassica cretica TaxID=69181 RepID=A0A8S9QCL2_BRACR|nr:hypothetical protein F2Q69_00018812 [Brassica cretica]